MPLNLPAMVSCLSAAICCASYVGESTVALVLFAVCMFLAGMNAYAVLRQVFLKGAEHG